MPRKVTVHWSKQFEFTKLLDNAPDVARDKNGLYMLIETLGTGYRKELIYIGIVKSNQRSFLKRMKEHQDDWLGKVAPRQIWVKFGAIRTHGRVDEYLIEDIESALVFGAVPRENSKKIQSYHCYYDVAVTSVNHEGFIKRTYETARQRALGK